MVNHRTYKQKNYQNLVQPFAVFAISAILVSLCAVFLFLGYSVFAGNEVGGVKLPQPAVMTAAAVVLIGLFLASLVIGKEVIYSTDDVSTIAARTEANASISAEELTDLASRVDEAADGIYNGLDTTKEIIGKTDLRKEAIEHGRNHANEKLISLAERIRQALRGERPLNPFDRGIAEHLTQGLQEQ